MGLCCRLDKSSADDLGDDEVQFPQDEKIRLEQSCFIKNAVLWKHKFGPVYDGVLLPDRKRKMSKRRRVLVLVCTAGGIRESSKSERLSKKKKGVKATGELELSLNEKKFVEQIATAARVGKNSGVVELIGAVVTSRPLSALCEHMPIGNLRSFLQRPDASQMDSSTQLQLTKEVAIGAGWLASKNIAHRHIAAENVLLDAHYKAKITLPMTYITYTDSFHIRGKAQRICRWMAPECLKSGIFNELSDVWSFGIMFWEVLDQCKRLPYPESSDADAYELVTGGKSFGQEDEIPEHVLYSKLGPLLIRCWNEAVAVRPCFEELIQVLEDATIEAWKWEQQSFDLPPRAARTGSSGSQSSQTSWQSIQLRSARESISSVMSNLSMCSAKSFETLSISASQFDESKSRNPSPQRIWSGNSEASESIWELVQTVFQTLHEPTTDERVEIMPSLAPVEPFHFNISDLKQFWKHCESWKPGQRMPLPDMPIELLEAELSLLKTCRSFAFDAPLRGAALTSDPLEQILHITRWYFHIVRSGLLHKYQLPGESGETYCCKVRCNEGGPETLMVCEQMRVDGEPAVSLCASCPSEGFSYTCTTSKIVRFFGNDIKTDIQMECIVQIGKDITKQRTYIVQFPNCVASGFCTNSIFTELVGRGGVLCQESGYQLDLDFLKHSPSMHDRHEVTGELYQGSQHVGRCCGSWIDFIDISTNNDSSDASIVFDEDDYFEGPIYLQCAEGSQAWTRWREIVCTMQERSPNRLVVKEKLKKIWDGFSTKESQGSAGMSGFKMGLNKLRSRSGSNRRSSALYMQTNAKDLLQSRESRNKQNNCSVARESDTNLRWKSHMRQSVV